MITIHPVRVNRNGVTTATVRVYDDGTQIGEGECVAESFESRHKLAESIARVARPHDEDVSRKSLAAEIAKALFGLATCEIEAAEDSTCTVARPKTFRELARSHQELRKPVVHGLLRVGETANIIAPPKLGKSWFVNDLALTVASGGLWLGEFQTEMGNVLILDNELHVETTAHRIPKVAAARGMALDDYADRLYVENLRGGLKDILSLGSYFDTLEPGKFKVIILDAFYRFMPNGTDENDNGALANIYNQLDRIADRLGCCFVAVHHTSKGNQGGKSITDVGAGAGSQSRAVDCHLVLRPHEEDGVIVLDAAVRSFKPIQPFCLEWNFPVWNRADHYHPTKLRRDGRKAAGGDPAEGTRWTPSSFAMAVLRSDPQPRLQIIERAVDELKISKREATRLLHESEITKDAFRWTPSSRNKPVMYATVSQPTGEQV